MMQDVSFADSTYKHQKLGYEIHAWSSHSANYHPKNILLNLPNDQSSRWSSGTNNQAQYVTLKLDKVAVAHTITFGKYHKIHVCNLKEFKVFGGISPDNMIELLHSGLRNDSEHETFSLKYKTKDIVFPCLYIKIAPLLAHGANFNFSIWYVELKGVADTQYVQDVYRHYVSYREQEAVRLCLKHFRQRNMLETFESLQEKTQIKLESPLLTQLYEVLVTDGNFAQAEEIMNEASKNQYFSEYIAECKYKPVWRVYKSDSPLIETPCQRGGHQMCIDPEAGKIYLLGGWNGTSDLPDFWCFNLQTQSWRCISKDTSRQNGPGSRSCHKICFDPKSGCIFSLGKYIDAESRPNVNLDGDFWSFDTRSEKWRKLSNHTAAEGGPELIYDHQMAIDSEKQVIYVFGGRAISPEPSTVSYSGLYSYNISTDTWKLIRNDTSQPENSVQLRSRIGHSMLLNPKTRELYIFAGQRAKDYLSDFFIYEIDTDTLHEVARDYSKSGGPEAGFTQRATFDPEFNEIYVLSGLMKDKTSANESVRNSFWVYNISKSKWTKIYQNENTGAEYWEKMKDVEPCPRYAHQLVYDPKRRNLHLFGGNPGSMTSPKLRLDDFWELGLSRKRPTAADVLRKSKFEIRMQEFKEICIKAFKSKSVESTQHAIHFLQHQVSQVVNHDDEEESRQFRSLTMWLFSWHDVGIWGKVSCHLNPISIPIDQQEVVGLASAEQDFNYVHGLRSEVYDALLKFFPEIMKEPTGNLVDLVPMNN